MAIHQSNIQTGLSWAKESWALFKLAPSKWISLGLSYIVLFFILPSLPGLQILSLVSTLIWPAFLVLAVTLYRNADNGITEAISQILTRIKPKLKQLVGLGALCLAYFVAVSLILGDDMQNVMKLVEVGAQTNAQVNTLLDKTLPLLLKLTLLLLPLLMFTWFSPMLIVYNNYSVIKAVKSSIAGLLQYMLALGISWLVFTLAFMLVMLGLGLVVGLITLVSATLGSILMVFATFGSLLVATAIMLAFQYVSYRDVFKAA